MDVPSARPITRSNIRVALYCATVFLFLALCILRAPAIFGGRFWAEEGLYYAIFHSGGWQKNLFIGPGYPMVLTNAAVLLSSLIPLQWAPLVTTYIGLGAQVILVVFITLWSERAGFNSINTLLIVAVVAVLPHSAELLANTTNLQWLFAAIALMILLDHGMTSPWLACTILFFCGLSGLAPALLLPAFALKSWLDRTWGSAAQLISLGASASIIIFIGLRYGTQLPARSYPLDPVLYIKALSIQGIVSPLAGFAAAAQIGRWYAFSKEQLGPVLVAIGTASVIFAAFAFALWRSTERRDLFLLGAAYWVSVILGIFGALEPSNLIPWPVVRYFFVPNLILLLLIGKIGMTKPWITAGVFSYIFLIHLWPDPTLQRTFFQGPSWSDELARTEAGRNDRIKIWPNGWTIKMN